MIHLQEFNPRFTEVCSGFFFFFLKNAVLFRSYNSNLMPKLHKLVHVFAHVVKC